MTTRTGDRGPRSGGERRGGRERSPSSRASAAAALAPVLEPMGRQERKERTRQALLDAALAQVADKGWGSVSLRQIARDAGIVPTAFYRHFNDLDELGLALVGESFATLRTMLRSARTDTSNYQNVVDWSVDILTRHVREHRKHFQFIVRERYSGVPVLRQAIRWELRLFISELALDLSRFPGLDKWNVQDLQILAELIVNSMVSIIELMVDATDDRSEAEIIEIARRQLRMIVVGAMGWKPRR